MPSELDQKGMEAARQKGRDIAGKQPGALVEAFAEVAASGAAAYLAYVAEAEPVAIQTLAADAIPSWPPLKKALWDVVTFEQLNDGHYINAYDLTDKLFFAAQNVHPAPSGMGVKEAPMQFFSENVDRWGAAEWFNRLAKAVRAQDDAVVAGNDIGVETYRNIAASSAMALVRGFEKQVRQALIQPAGSDAGEAQCIPGAASAQNPLEWAIERWNAEVKNRPLKNIHRRALDTTWRQVIRHFGGDADACVGPSHDELVDAHPEEFREAASAQSPTVGEITEAEVERAWSRFIDDVRVITMGDDPKAAFRAALSAASLTRLPDAGKAEADVAEFMRRLGPRWFLEQGWFPASISDALPDTGRAKP